VIDRDGFAVCEGVVADALRPALLRVFDELVGDDAGRRDALRHPAVAELAQSPTVRALAERTLGPAAFAIRATLFDKHERRNWPVAWHQDRTVPVRARREVAGFTSWSRKGAVWHVEPDVNVLSRLLAVRVDLDGSHDANGGLRVLPGSHRLGILTRERIDALLANGGDLCPKVVPGGALLMRPLLLHGSKRAVAAGHRRVVHLEFCAAPLPDPLEFVDGLGVAAE